MPQEVSTKEGKSDQPWSMDANANRLMDDIFADVERVLETGSETPTVPAEPAEYASFQKMAVPSVTIPADITPRATVAQPNTKPEKTPKRQQQSGKSLEKWLLIAACASLGITLLLWVLGQGRLNSLFGNNSASTTKATQASQKDLAFVDYMQRSLESIDQKAEERKQVAVLPPAPPPTQPPLPVLVPGNLPQNANRPNVLERVYIPVYPQPRIIYTNPNPNPNPNPASPAARPSPQASAPTPAAKPSPQASATASPSPRPAASPKPEATSASRPVATAPSTPKPSAAPTPKPTTAAAKPPASPTQAASESPRVAAVTPSPAAQPTFRNRSTQATAPTPVNQYSLRGVLLLGNRSAAIFEVGGVSRRIYVGESIGSSGWTLVEINNENSEAVIRKNGEVRSIFVGQQF